MNDLLALQERSVAEEPRDFVLLGRIRDVEVIATGSGVRIRHLLRSKYGGRAWRKMKGVALVEKDNGWVGETEIHWFESHGIGKVQWKIKRQLER